MLARILPIFALIVLAVLGYYLYSQGNLQQIIRPSVSVLVSERRIIEGRQLRAGDVRLEEVGINLVPDGAITFRTGTTPQEAVESLGGQAASSNIAPDTRITSALLGEGSSFVVLRASRDIAAGDNLSLRNIEATVIERTPPAGAIIFENEEAALVYINQAFDMVARQAIFSRQILTITQTAGGTEKVFIVQSSRPYDVGDRLSIDGLEAVEIAVRDLPPGTIAFQTRGATDVFITSASRYRLSEALDAGQPITAELISNEGLDQDEVDPDDLPRTLAELTAYMRAYPNRAMFVDRTNLIGRGVEPGDRIDIWSEINRTAGAFGEIRLERLASGVVVREAIDTSRPERPAEGDMAEDGEGMQAAPGQAPIGETTEQEDGPEPGERRYLWVSTQPSIKAEYDSARDENGVSFIVRDDAPVVDVLGNGASCLDDRCTVNRAASEDLGDIVAELTPEDAESLTESISDEDTLTVLDGVSPALEERLRAEGYTTFEDIAGWQDAEIPAIRVRLDISNNLAVYIRQQARIQVEAPGEAARSLGFEEAPIE